MQEDFNNIELTLPLEPEFVSIVRLTASGIANCMGFDIEIIEDIKVALAEVCNKLITFKSSAKSYNIVFSLKTAELRIVIYCDEQSLVHAFDIEKDELGISIIEALMDKIELGNGNSYIISMIKRVEVE